VCCSCVAVVLQLCFGCIAFVLQCVAVRASLLAIVTGLEWYSVLQVCCSVLQCVAVVMQCVAVVLQ